jgi:hypothetical protein
VRKPVTTIWTSKYTFYHIVLERFPKYNFAAKRPHDVRTVPRAVVPRAVNEVLAVVSEEDVSPLAILLVAKVDRHRVSGSINQRDPSRRVLDSNLARIGRKSEIREITERADFSKLFDLRASPK